MGALLPLFEGIRLPLFSGTLLPIIWEALPPIMFGGLAPLATASHALLYQRVAVPEGGATRGWRPLHMPTMPATGATTRLKTLATLRAQDWQRISMDLTLTRCALADLTTMSQEETTVLHWRRICYLVQKPEAQPQCH